MSDVAVENHGSVFLLQPLTRTGKEWLQDNITSSESQWFGDAAVCEPRYVADIVKGMQDEGIKVQ